MRPETLERYPAFAASLLLHAGVVIAALVFGSLLSRPVFGPTVVPVTLMTSAAANPSPAIQAPTPTEATAPPQPPTPEVSPAPAPTPTPAPAKAAAAAHAPSPKPAPTAPIKTPAKPVQPAADDNALFDKINKDLAHNSGRPAAARPSRVTQPETAIQARLSSGTTSAAAEAGLESLSQQLNKVYHPDCDFRGGNTDINIPVQFTLRPNGTVLGEPTSPKENDPDPLINAAARHAIRAVYQAAQPFQNLPPELYGRKIDLNFNPKQACAQK